MATTRFTLLALSLVAATLALAPSQARAIVTAGTLYVDLDASHASAGSPLWHNAGTIGDFVRIGAPISVSREGATGLFFNGTATLDAYQSAGSAPAGITGLNASRTIEAWVWNPSAPVEETIVSWGRRGGPAGSNMSFNYGTSGAFGAVGHWDFPDLGWNNAGGAPAARAWHHLAYTFSDTDFTTRVYVDGVLANSEVLASGNINTHTVPKISIAAQNENDVSLNTGLRGSMVIGKMRIHDGVLSTADIMNNYLEEVGGFPAPEPVVPQILPAGPVHRWSFNGDANDSVGTQHGTLMNGATISGGRVILDGTDDFVDLHGNDIAAIGAANGAITLEGWATTESTTGAWARLIDLGDTNPGGLGRNYLFISPTASGAVTRGSISDADPGFNHEEFTDGPIQNNGLVKQYAMVFDDANNEMTLYIDGTLVSSNVMTIPLSAISPNLGYLAKSLYPDSYLRGNIDEMRIYNYALNANHVLGNYENGPDFINAVPEPSSYAMAAIGIAGLIGVVRRRRK